MWKEEKSQHLQFLSESSCNGGLRTYFVLYVGQTKKMSRTFEISFHVSILKYAQLSDYSFALLALWGQQELAISLVLV